MQSINKKSATSAENSIKSYPCRVEGCCKVYKHSYSLTRHCNAQHEASTSPPPPLMRQFGRVDGKCAPRIDYSESCAAADEHSNESVQPGPSSSSSRKRHYVNSYDDVSNDDDDDDGDDRQYRSTAEAKRYAPVINSRDLSADDVSNWERIDTSRTIERVTENALLCERFLDQYEITLDRRPTTIVDHIIAEVNWMLFCATPLFDSMYALSNLVPGLYDTGDGHFILIRFVWQLSRSWIDEAHSQHQLPQWRQLVSVFAFGAMIMQKRPQARKQVQEMLTYFMGHYGVNMLEQRGGWNKFLDYCER